MSDEEQEWNEEDDGEVVDVKHRDVADVHEDLDKVLRSVLHQLGKLSVAGRARVVRAVNALYNT